MALQKTLEHESGYDLNYHRIVSIVYTPKIGCNIIIESYKDATARQNGKKPLRQHAMQCSVSGVDNDQPLLQQMYGLVKQSALFDGSSDV